MLNAATVILTEKSQYFNCNTQVITKHNLNIGKDVTDGVIHNKPGAAITLVEQLYIVLTNRV